jgi:hypothetical protein
MKVIAKRKNEEKGYIEYHLIQIGTWDLFGDISRFFEEKCEAVPHVKNDGVITRVWQFRYKDEYFMFEHHEDVGNWFYSCSDEDDSDGVKELTEKLEFLIRKT